MGSNESELPDSHRKITVQPLFRHPKLSPDRLKCENIPKTHILYPTSIYQVLLHQGNVE